MEASIVDAIVQVGILPVIIGILLIDQSKKMAAMQIELAKINQTLQEIEKHIEQCKK
jgi:hypothetical protein